MDNSSGNVRSSILLFFGPFLYSAIEVPSIRVSVKTPVIHNLTSIIQHHPALHVAVVFQGEKEGTRLTARWLRIENAGRARPASDAPLMVWYQVPRSVLG